MREISIEKILKQKPILSQIDSFPIWQISNSKTQPGQFWLLNHSLLPVSLWVFHEKNRQIKLLSHQGKESKESFLVPSSSATDSSGNVSGELHFSKKEMYGPFGRGFQLETLEPNPSLFGEGLFSASLIFLAQKLIEKSLEPRCFLYEVPPFLLSFFQSLNIEIREWNPEKYGTEKNAIRKSAFHNAFISVSNKTLQGLKLSLHLLSYLPSHPEKNHLETRSTQVLLSEFRGCGFGACLACVVRTSEGYRKICSEGPVFYAGI